MSKIIDVTISPTGETTVKTTGFKGKSCQDASRFLEQALGAAESEKRTAEFYQPEEQHVRQQG